MKNLALIFSILFIFSCTETGKELTSKDLEISNNFNFENLRDVNYEDTLYIKTRFSECGEWGGHDEIIKLYFVKDKRTIMQFKRNEINNCDERNDKGEIIKKIALEKQILLSKTEKKAVMIYINNLTKSKFLESGFSNAANCFTVESSNKNFRISTCNNQVFNLESYNNLLKDLQIPD